MDLMEPPDLLVVLGQLEPPEQLDHRDLLDLKDLLELQQSVCKKKTAIHLTQKINTSKCS